MIKSKSRIADFKPSDMMRAKRPELYSDSAVSNTYRLSRPVFGHHLSSLTERNEHKPFEEFCRALAQREICRNLRPQTGPEGGGDGKVDTETYPVSSDVSRLWFEGITNEKGESWAFAFSAKKAWTAKVKSDTKGIVETGRQYKHIHFFTNQNPRAKKRLEIEAELTKEYGIPVTIYDRNWIEEKTINNDHMDLAYDILGVGEFDPTQERKGANDTYRENELNDIEANFSHLDKSRITDIDSVHEALRAAQLSRNLERPRYETDGRFARAIKLAEKFGTERQKFVAKYEKAWTAVWWFDDLDTPNTLYDELEAIAVTDGESFELERLSNLLTIFVGRERHSADEAEQYRIDARSSTLGSTLAKFAADKQRPNHALYAETLLTLHELTGCMRAKETEHFDGIWKHLTDIVDRAQGLGEFPAELIEKMTEVLSEIAPESTAFDELVLKVAEFAGDRKKDGQQGEILLRRGRQKLDHELPLEAIVWLGKAALAFNKNEYRDKQFETLYCLGVAYRGAGLYWAARSCALSCMVTLSIIANEEGEIPGEAIPAAKLFCLISLQLGHLPNSLQALYLLRLYQSHLTLSEDGSKKLEADIIELDHLLACNFMALENSALQDLSYLPDFLDQTQLYAARLVLLYRLGYENIIREDRSVPPDIPDEELVQFMSTIAAQPATKDMARTPVLNLDRAFTFRTKVLGVEYSFSCDGSAHQISVCEFLVSSLEGFAATMLNRDVFPQSPSASIIIRSTGDVIAIQHDRHTFTTFVEWPETLTPGDPTNLATIHDELMRFLIGTLDLVMSIRDPETLFEELFRDEQVYGRSVVFSNTAISHGRLFGREFTRIGDVPVSSVVNYPVKETAPDIVPADLPKKESEKFERDFEVHRHTDLSVHTIINPHLWNDANWQGTAYFSYQTDYPPILGLLYKDADAGRKIFEQLREKVGEVDKEELIRIAVLKGIDKTHPFFYNVHIASSRSAFKISEMQSGPFMSLSRHNLMEAKTHEHLNFFLSELERVGAYFLVPAKMTPQGPEPQMDLRILIRRLHVTDAWQVDSQHEDAPAIIDPENVYIPEGEKNPPIAGLIEMHRSMRDAS